MKKLLIMALVMFHTLSLMAQGKPITISLSATGNDTASVQVFLPNAKKATGRAVLICPGGGYAHLAMAHEGVDWAPFFNKLGIAVAVLKYRMPHGDRTLPIADAEDGIRLLREHATEWHINSNDIGIMGSSAGGHLAATIATHSMGDAAPNFQILFYPVITMDKTFTHMGSRTNLLGKVPSEELEKEFSNEQQVTEKTPRAFIALSSDDRSVPPANGVEYYLSCVKHNVPATLHVFPTGGHGWGSRASFLYHTEMELELQSWLRSF